MNGSPLLALLQSAFELTYRCLVVFASSLQKLHNNSHSPTKWTLCKAFNCKGNHKFTRPYFTWWRSPTHPHVLRTTPIFYTICFLYHGFGLKNHLFTNRSVWFIVVHYFPESIFLHWTWKGDSPGHDQNNKNFHVFPAQRLETMWSIK